MKIKLLNHTVKDLDTELGGKPLKIKAGEAIDVSNDELIELKRKHHFLRVVKEKEPFDKSKSILNRLEFGGQKEAIAKEAKEHGYLPSQEKKLKLENKDKKKGEKAEKLQKSDKNGIKVGKKRGRSFKKSK